ncbi:hypothetical protein BCT19_01245 [Vibrio splendidus]|uniref:hypothetical protein n=1 Tax=Vibrio splendidus TaxID=29497 RepID=UPI000C834D31|nr:hypothetical protein [Vibrio splendidus]PMO04337.1 hypothetical protein BCT19_01245 [Vibrio splendidus]
MDATNTLQQKHSGMFDAESGKKAQLLSAKSRSENAQRRNELKAIAKVSLSELLSEHGLDVSLTNEQKLEVKMHFLKQVLAPLAVDTQRHNHKLVEMVVQQELDEMLKESPSKQDIKVSGEKMSLVDALKSGVVDDSRISLEDINFLRGYVQ